MLDLTDDIMNWVKCCKEIWENWFKKREIEEDEFYEVEEALFSTMVLSNIEMVERPNLIDFYTSLKGVYKIDVTDERSVCKRQKSGNIFCQSQKVTHKKNMSFPIKSIDFMGTMLDGVPYVELKINDQEFVLEPLENIFVLAAVEKFQNV